MTFKLPPHNTVYAPAPRATQKKSLADGRAGWTWEVRGRVACGHSAPPAWPGPGRAAWSLSRSWKEREAECWRRGGLFWILIVYAHHPSVTSLSRHFLILGFLLWASAPAGLASSHANSPTNFKESKAKQSKRAWSITQRSVRNYVFHFTILVPATVMSLSLSWEQPWLGLIPLDVSHCTGPFTPLPVANHPFSSIKSVPATLVSLKNAPCAHTLMYPKVMGDTTFSSALSPLQIPPLPLSFSFIAPSPWIPQTQQNKLWRFFSVSHGAALIVSHT